jgi:hypothetical protein
VARRYSALSQEIGRFRVTAKKSTESWEECTPVLEPVNPPNGQMIYSKGGGRGVSTSESGVLSSQFGY